MLRKFNQRKAVAHNKTFADVFDSMLTDWKKFISFISMLLCLVALVLISFSVMNKYSGSTIKEINLSASGPKVIFETKSPNGKTQYLLMVHPQGWQNTGIQIDEKSKVSFKADGSVNIDGGGLFETISDRKKLEKVKKAEYNLDENSPDERQTPEYYFSDEEKKNVMLARPWVDPDGLTQNTTDARFLIHTYANRAKRLELKGGNLGCLIGKITDSSKDTQPFKIGKKHYIESAVSGVLWLNVNDVKNLQPGLPQQMFYQDNLGFFWVVVTIDN